MLGFLLIIVHSAYFQYLLISLMACFILWGDNSCVSLYSLIPYYILSSLPSKIRALASPSSSLFSQESFHELFNSLSYKNPCQRRGTRFIVRADKVRCNNGFAFASYSYHCINFIYIVNLVDYIALLQDYYSVLGVSKNSSKSDIKSGN